MRVHRHILLITGYKGKILGCLGIIILLVIGILMLTVDHQRSQYPVKFLVVRLPLCSPMSVCQALVLSDFQV